MMGLTKVNKIEHIANRHCGMPTVTFIKQCGRTTICATEFN